MRDLGEILYHKGRVIELQTEVGVIECILLDGHSTTEMYKKHNSKGEYKGFVKNEFTTFFIAKKYSYMYIVLNDANVNYAIEVIFTRSDVSSYQCLLDMAEYFDSNMRRYTSDINNPFVVSKAPSSPHLTMTTKSVVESAVVKNKNTKRSIKYGKMKVGHLYFNENRSAITALGIDDDGYIIGMTFGGSDSNTFHSNIVLRLAFAQVQKDIHPIEHASLLETVVTKLSKNVYSTKKDCSYGLTVRINRYNSDSTFSYEGRPYVSELHGMIHNEILNIPEFKNNISWLNIDYYPDESV